MGTELAVLQKGYGEKLSCSKDTKNLIMSQCVDEFLRHHPELKGINVTQNMILNHIGNFYLKS